MTPVKTCVSKCNIGQCKGCAGSTGNIYVIFLPLIGKQVTGSDKAEANVISHA